MGYLSRFKWELMVNKIGKSRFIPYKLRICAYKSVGMKIDAEYVRPNCIFRGENIIIEKGCYLNNGVFIDCEKEMVHIKENVWIAFNVLIFTSTHLIGNKDKRAGQSVYLPVTIGKGCWIGANSIIFPGVTIGDGTVIAASSTVTKDCDSNSLYAGTTARKIKDL